MRYRERGFIAQCNRITLIPGIGTLTQNRIWNTLSDIADLFSMGEKSLGSLGLSGEVCPAIRSRSYRAIAAEIYDWGSREGCRFLVRGDPGYPPLLGGDIRSPSGSVCPRPNGSLWNGPALRWSAHENRQFTAFKWRRASHPIWEAGELPSSAGWHEASMPRPTGVVFKGREHHRGSRVRHRHRLPERASPSDSTNSRKRLATF